MILEDDAVPSVKPNEVVTTLYRMFEQFAKQSHDVDVILLNTLSNTNNDQSSVVLGRVSKTVPGAHAYLVPVAKIPLILLKGGPPFLGYWDRWWDWDFMGIKRYAMHGTNLFPQSLTTSSITGKSGTDHG